MRALMEEGFVKLFSIPAAEGSPKDLTHIPETAISECKRMN
jgi:hypothetical protein